MIESIQIAGYRGIRTGELLGLAPLTILVGPNGAGKSSALEALEIVRGNASEESLQHALTRRGWSGLAALRSIVGAKIAWTEEPEAEHTLKVQLVANTPTTIVAMSDGGERVTVDFGEEGSRGGIASAYAPATPTFIEIQPGSPDEIRQIISRADLDHRLASVVKLLTTFIPGLTDLRLLQPGTRPAIFAVEGEARYPLSEAADGAKRALSISERIVRDSSGLILIEEPEAFMHPRAMRAIASVLWGAIEMGKQVVFTTHSLEFIDAILAAARADLAKLALFRMRMQDGALVSARIDGARVADLRERLGEDLR